MKTSILVLCICVLFFTVGFQFYWRVQHDPSLLIGVHRAALKSSTVRDYIARQRSGGYPLVKIEDITAGNFFGPRAEVIGEVAAAERFEDGDWHVNVDDGAGHILVCEIIPQHQLEIPKPHFRVWVRGIARFDQGHGWWELNPVFEWGYVSPSEDDHRR